MTDSFPEQFRALVIGARGAIGQAMVALLNADTRCQSVVGIGRQTDPGLDFETPASIEACCATLLAQQQRFHLIIIATGMLHSPTIGPEKKLSDLNFATMQQLFCVNTLGPGLLISRLSALLDRQRGVMAVLSAKVGSIEDNRLGGWYSYRASKAALNMLIKTAAIELKRTQPNTVLIALHPGTVTSNLSRPFGGASTGRPAHDAARDMLTTINSLAPTDSGSFVSYSGERLPW
jgi:NAD(P)-dependent dehydrogenase (short-subunit alcohol dehydrogenase family)